jgi:hypothetical protein
MHLLGERAGVLGGWETERWDSARHRIIEARVVEVHCEWSATLWVFQSMRSLRWKRQCVVLRGAEGDSCAGTGCADE